MTAKVRIEFVRLSQPGQDSGDAVNQVAEVYGAQEITVTGGPVTSAVAPQFGTDGYGAQNYEGAARILALSGAVNVNWQGFAATETNASRCEPGLPLMVPLSTGETLSIIEAADGPSGGGGGSSGNVAVTNTVTTSDANSAPFGGEVSLTPGTPIAAGRSLKVVCTSAGVVQVEYPDSSTGLWPVVPGTQTLPVAAINIVSGGTTAVASYFNLK